MAIAKAGPLSPQARRAKRTLQWTGIFLLFGSVYEALYVVRVLPLEILQGRFFFADPQSLTILVLLTAMTGAGLLNWSRSVRDLEVSTDGVRLPTRSMTDVLLRLPAFLSFQDIARVRVAVIRGRRIVEFELRRPRGRQKVVRLPTDWVRDEAEFETRLGRLVPLEKSP